MGIVEGVVVLSAVVVCLGTGVVEISTRHEQSADLKLLCLAVNEANKLSLVDAVLVEGYEDWLAIAPVQNDRALGNKLLLGAPRHRESATHSTVLSLNVSLKYTRSGRQLTLVTYRWGG